MAKVVPKRAAPSERPKNGGSVEAAPVQLDAPAAVSAQLPQLPPAPKFLLVCSPETWIIDAQGRIVPGWGNLVIEPGVNNVEHPSHWRDAVSRERAAGFDVVDLLSAGSPPGGCYLVKVAVPGGSHYMTCFDTVYGGSSRREYDRDAAESWAWRLVGDGVIRPPAAHALRALLSDLELSERRQADLGHSSPSQAARAVQTQRRIERLRTYLDSLDAAAVPVSSSPAGLDT